MDQIDRLLLHELQEDADRSLDDLGEVVGLSASAVQRRIRRLKADGVISRVVAELDPLVYSPTSKPTTTCRASRRT